MKLKRGFAGGLYAVFPSEWHAEKWQWLFYGALRRRYACFGGYMNAFKIL